MKHLVVLLALAVFPTIAGFFVGVLFDVGHLFGIGHGRHELERLLHMGVGTLLGFVVGLLLCLLYGILQITRA